MKKDITELVFILDKSGSMAGLEKDTIGGYNAMLESQKKIDGECRISTVLFNERVRLVHDRVDIRAVSPISEREYSAGGSTALLDAIGFAIDKTVNAERNTAEEYRAGKVMLVIITDGEENASREYSPARIRAMINREKTQYGWEFIFLGANIDAVTAAGRYGIAPDRAGNYHADGDGVAVNFRAMTKTVASFRAQAGIPDDWQKEIEKDYEGRDARR